jgi:hypothetical protein
MSHSDPAIDQIAGRTISESHLQSQLLVRLNRTQRFCLTWLMVCRRQGATNRVPTYHGAFNICCARFEPLAHDTHCLHSNID